MKTTFGVAVNEFRNILRDKGVMLIFFGAIIIYPLFYPIPYSAEVLKNIPVGVVDLSNTDSSRKLVRMIDANEFIHIERKYNGMAEAKKVLIEGKIGGILLIPGDFEKQILRGEQARVSAYCDASYFLIYRQVLTGISYGVGTFSAGIEIKRMMANGLMQENAYAMRDPLSLISYPLFNPQGGYATYVVPAVLILILQQTLLIGIGMIAGTEREKNENPSVLKAHPVQQVLGKTIAYFLIYMIHSVYIFGILFHLYRFPGKAHPLELFLFLTPFLLSVIFLALAISAIFKNREISITVLIFTSIPALFVSGFSWPKESIPKFLRIISWLLPSTAGIDGFLKLNQMGASLYDIYDDWLILSLLCIVYFISAVFIKSEILNGE